MKPGSHRYRIPTWRFVAGVLLHCVAPAYLVATPIAAVLSSPEPVSLDAVLRRLPVCSAWFLAGYTALSLVALAAAIVAELALGSGTVLRSGHDPEPDAAASKRRVAEAIARGRYLGVDSAAVLAGMRGDDWDHSDPRVQTLTVDLLKVVQTSAAALSTAPAARHAALQDLAAASLHRIAGAHAALRDERSRLDEGDARAVARYVETRYRRSEFPGEDP